MPRSFSGGGFRARPDPKLFAVPYQPEKAFKEPEHENETDAHSIEDLTNWVDNLLENEAAQFVEQEMSTPPEPSPDKYPFTGAAVQPMRKLPGTFALDPFIDQANVWGAQDPLGPVAGTRPPCVLTGPGAQVETGVAIQQPPTESEPEEEARFEWLQLTSPLITEDAHGASVKQCTLTGAGGRTYVMRITPNSPLLFWSARRMWMWHRKWTLPAMRVDVEVVGPPHVGPPPKLSVMITAGTLPGGAEHLHDAGLDGECQRQLKLDASGRGWVHFSHLLFKHTSFNCGSRPFHLVVTLLAEQPPDEPASRTTTASTTIEEAPACEMDLEGGPYAPPPELMDVSDSTPAPKAHSEAPKATRVPLVSRQPNPKA